jgi:hypothetical protein
MRCKQCGGALHNRTGRLVVPDKLVAEVVVDDASFRKCRSCGELWYPPGTSRRITKARSAKIDEIVNSYPQRAFVTPGETAEMLGCSRQALHKNRKVLVGSIYSVLKGDRTRLFLRQSAEEYLRSGDGRFPLVSSGCAADGGEQHPVAVNALDPNVRKGGSILSKSSPEARPEIVSRVLDPSALRGMIDLLCREADYYPQPPYSKESMGG